MNATKYLFCCVHFTVHVDTVKMCLHSVDSLHSMDFVPSGTVQRFRLLLDSTGGGGYAPGHFRAVSPPNRFQPKRLPSLLEKSRKRKKDLQTEVLKDWECGKNLKKLLKNYLTTLL